MKFIRYSKFNGFDVSGVNLGDLMGALQDALLQSGYDDDYYWTRQRRPQDTSLDALRQALLQALVETGELTERQIEQMLEENGGQFKGSQLEELINQLIERLVEEGYLKLSEEPRQADERRRRRGQAGPGEVGEPLPRDVKFEVTEKGLDFLGYKTLRNLLGSLGKSSVGRHDTPHLSTGVEASQSPKPYEFGDTINLDVNTTLLSAIKREGLTVPLNLEYRDLHVHQQDYQSSCATVVMLDCSHSMILYGEDRFTPAKKVALALTHLIRTQFPGDTLRVVLFHDSAEEIPLAALPQAQVGPYHTNTAEGLKLARRILMAQKKDMRQIVMITDGKPSALTMPNGQIYKNSMGLDATVIAQTLREVAHCRRSGIMINTFMLARDRSLVEFVKRVSEISRGKAYFTTTMTLGQFILMDFLRRKTKTVS